jgi:hypothetical protein
MSQDQTLLEPALSNLLVTISGSSSSPPQFHYSRVGKANQPRRVNEGPADCSAAEFMDQLGRSDG